MSPTTCIRAVPENGEVPQVVERSHKPLLCGVAKHPSNDLCFALGRLLQLHGSVLYNAVYE